MISKFSGAETAFRVNRLEELFDLLMRKLIFFGGFGNTAERSGTPLCEVFQRLALLDGASSDFCPPRVRTAGGLASRMRPPFAATAAATVAWPLVPLQEQNKAQVSVAKCCVQAPLRICQRLFYEKMNKQPRPQRQKKEEKKTGIRVATQVQDEHFGIDKIK